MVAGTDSAEETIKSLVAADLEEISLNKPCAVVDVISQKSFLLNADNIAV